jgi:hypothetical protein
MDGLRSLHRCAEIVLYMEGREQQCSVARTGVQGRTGDLCTAVSDAACHATDRKTVQDTV